MKTNQLVQVCGSIIKEESIVPITSNIAENTCVAEANMPYSDYYGIAPFNMPTKPNSLFLFTVPYYSLQEVLRFAQLIDLCCMPSLNIAVSVLEFSKDHYPAIRIKNFPDYKMISKLQECFIEQGVIFAKKAHIDSSAIIRTNKFFSLEKVEENIYIDHLQEKTGYIALSKLIKQDYFLQVIANIRNNTNCAMFDAARGAILLDSKITDIVRIYSGNLDAELLKCIQNKFEHSI
jgi:hypothetical protein